MTFHLSSLWKTHPAGSGTNHTQTGASQETEQGRNVRYYPSDMAFLDEEDIKRLSVIHHQPGTN